MVKPGISGLAHSLPWINWLELPLPPDNELVQCRLCPVIIWCVRKTCLAQGYNTTTPPAPPPLSSYLNQPLFWDFWQDKVTIPTITVKSVVTLILSKTNIFYRRPSGISKTSFWSIAKPPSPPLQCWDMLRGHCHVVTTLKRGEGVEMWNWRLKNTPIQGNMSFLGSVSTAFVHDWSSITKLYRYLLEQFSIECCKTATKVITSNQSQGTTTIQWTNWNLR